MCGSVRKGKEEEEEGSRRGGGRLEFTQLCKQAHEHIHVTCDMLYCMYVQVEEIELKPNGGDIDVVEENKKEYVK